MSELEHCRLAYEGKLEQLKEKIESNKFEDLSRKKDQSGRTALHWACVGAKKDIVDYLYETFKVKLDEPDEAGWTPLMISSSVGCLNLVKFFIEKHCNPNSTNENLQRPLHYACSKNFPSIAKALLDAGAENNAGDKYGSTALHRAASKGNIKIVDMLLSEYGSSVNLSDCEGNTPLHLACEEERIDVVKLLLKYGANAYVKNKEEKTPIDISNGGLLNLLK